MKINRSNVQIKANPNRVILNYFKFGDDHNSEKIQHLISRVISIPDQEINQLYVGIKKEFAFRHRNFEHILEKNFKIIQPAIPGGIELSNSRKLVMGAYFSHEYSIQAAALFNPSMIAHPDQKGLKKCEKRFILSLRSVGEGHISSIEFRSGIVDVNGNITLDKETGFATCSEKKWDKIYCRNNKLKNTALLKNFDQTILQKFEEKFTYDDYLKKVNNDELSAYDKLTQEKLFRILNANYDVIADKKGPLCERVIFPNSDGESKGMEDVRLVAFTENDTIEYIGTYTEYDGQETKPQLIITEDFIEFEVRAMYGNAVDNKGMALFPEKINGKYVMLGRQGGENITIMYSDDLFIWKDYEIIMTPEDTWGCVQLGNCGSPLKTTEGWLVITHAVGPMRKYVLGAILLDLEDPSKIIMKLNKPLLSPNEVEREGYVPNVVYSCGSMVHEGNLILPYAMSDSASTFVTINIEDLLNEMDVYKSKSDIKHVI